MKSHLIADKELKALLEEWAMGKSTDRLSEEIKEIKDRLEMLSRAVEKLSEEEDDDKERDYGI